MLDGLRWTGPRGRLGSNEWTFRDAGYNPYADHQLRARLRYGLDTHYLVVLRVLTYEEPSVRFGRGYAARVDLAGYLFDLPRSTLLCTFTAGENLATTSVIVHSKTHLMDAIFKQLQANASDDIARKLVTLTGGVADAAVAD